MKKTILSLGKALSKDEQRQLTGGNSCDYRYDPFCIEYGPCETDCDCCFWQICSPFVNNTGICN